MAETMATERPTASPEEIWAILREAAEWRREYEKGEAAREVRRQEEEAKRREEDAAREAKRREEEAAWEAKRREEEAAREAKWQADFERRQAEFDQQKAEFDRQQAKRNEAWEKLDERFDRTERMINQNNQNLGGLGRSFGKLVEHLVGPGILKRFGEHGYHFSEIKKRRHKLRDEDGNEEAEIDILLENDDTVIAVEVKTRPNEGDYLVSHLIRLDIMREHSKAEGWEGKQILGAIAGAIFDTPVRNATLKAGLFVIEQSGDTMKMDLPKGFKPREW